MKSRFLILLIYLLPLSISASNEGSFGLREEEANMAHKTLRSVRTNLDNAIRKVEDELYPNLRNYLIKTNAPITNTTILIDFIGQATLGSIPSNPRIPTPPRLPSPPPTYKSNPYIARLAVIETGLRIQLKFVSNARVSSSINTIIKIPMFEPFFGKRIVMIPIFSITYDESNTSIVTNDTKISTWKCLSDADEGMSISGTTISEGMRSVVSMAGGDLGSCQFISSSNLDKIWAPI